MNSVGESKVFLKHEVKIGHDFLFPVVIHDYDGTLKEAHFTHAHISEALENAKRREKIKLYDDFEDVLGGITSERIKREQICKICKDDEI